MSKIQDQFNECFMSHLEEMTAISHTLHVARNHQGTYDWHVVRREPGKPDSITHTGSEQTRKAATERARQQLAYLRKTKPRMPR